MYDAVIKNSYCLRKKRNLSGKILLSLIILFMILFFAITTYGSKPAEYNIITIKEGDTLWSIVNLYNKKNMDPRKMISDIKRLNNLDDVILQPGQKIKIPEY